MVTQQANNEARLVRLMNKLKNFFFGWGSLPNFGTFFHHLIVFKGTGDAGDRFGTVYIPKFVKLQKKMRENHAPIGVAVTPLLGWVTEAEFAAVEINTFTPLQRTEGETRWGYYRLPRHKTVSTSKLLERPLLPGLSLLPP